MSGPLRYIVYVRKVQRKFSRRSTEYLKKDSVNFGNFIKGLTNYNVQERFTASQALNHPFLRESGYL